MTVGCGKSSSLSPTESTTTLTQAASTAQATAQTATTAATDDDAKFTCYSKENGMCMRFDDLALGDINDARKSCSDPGEKFSTDACPTQGLLGTCTDKAKGDDPAVTTFLYKSDLTSTVAAAKDFCKDLPGVFTPATTRK